MSSRLFPALRFDAAEPLDAIVQRLNEWQPEVLGVYPSVLRQLAEEQIAGRLRIALRHIGTSAEVLTADTRRRVMEAWSIRVSETYGATEYAPIAAECSHGRKHLFEDGAVIEIADERGPVPPGVPGNRVLLTVFHRYTQPLIRYEISDIVQAMEGECECGRPFRTIESIEGREQEILWFCARDSAETVAVHPAAFHRLLDTAPVSGWQVVKRNNELHINLIGLRDAEFCRALERKVREFLESRGIELSALRVAPADELQRGATGKAPLIFDASERRGAVVPEGGLA